jgi:dTDP-4-amino-4,6-dideoxygalactose transaminase
MKSVSEEIANLYIANIKNETIILPHIHDQSSHVWHLFVIRSCEREKLICYLTENDVQTLIHYPVPPHRQRAYEEFNNLSLPITEKIHNEVLSLPLHVNQRNEETEKIINLLNKF